MDDQRQQQLIDLVRRGELQTAYTLISRECAPRVDLGLVIVQLTDRHTLVGYCHVVRCPVRGPVLITRAARRVHRWGTTTGLDQLVAGPRPKTVLQPVSAGHEVPLTSVQFTLAVAAVSAAEWGIEDPEVSGD